MYIDELYREYGDLMVQFEIIQAKINSVKQRIVQELNKKQDVNDKING